MLRIRIFQFATVLLAGASAATSLHWLVTFPDPISPARNELGFFAAVLFYRVVAWSGYSAYLKLALGLLAITILTAASLATVLALKVPERIEVRRLALSLALGSFSVAYFYFLTTSASVRTAIGWSPASPWRLPADFLAYAAAGLSPVLLARFFLGYPRAATDDDWQAHFRRLHELHRDDIRRGKWHYRLVPGMLRARVAASPEKSSRFDKAFEEWQFANQIRILGLLKSRGGMLVAAAWALVLAGIDWVSASGVVGSRVFTAFKPLLSVFFFTYVIAIPLLAVFESMRLGKEETFDEDRRKVDWIRSTMLVAGLLLAAALPLTMAFGFFALSRLADASVFIPANVLFIGPTFFAVVLFFLFFLLALALSIFYRGAVDPRLAARKLTLLGALGLIVTALFIFLERTVAAKLVTWLNLAPDSGGLLAGAAVASTFVPVRNRTEKAVNAVVGRLLPLESVIEGDIKTIAVAISDLSGYTALSSRDERQALLVAALLQRQSARLVNAHGGRIVKSMGDAVLFAFDDATAAVKVLSALHRDFQPAAEQLGLEPLAVHSGAHWGEVTVAQDGDIYGQTVNIAARIQGSAEVGQIVVSKAFADAARNAASFRELGSRRFKNVAEPVACEELGMA